MPRALAGPVITNVTAADVLIVDGAAVVNMMKPTQIQRTFKDYAFGSFLPFVNAQLLKATRIDLYGMTIERTV